MDKACLYCVILGWCGLALLGGAAEGEATASSMVRWQVVAELPKMEGQQKAGLAGVFAGALDDRRLLVAGGTYYEDKGPLEGGMRSYSDRMLVLSQAPGAAGAAPAYTWMPMQPTLLRPLAYGASVTLDDGVLLIGGTDGIVCVPDVRWARWDQTTDQLVVTEFPALPKPLAYLGAGQVGHWVLAVGGTTSPDGKSGADVFGLDLTRRESGGEFVWQSLPAMPVAAHFPIVVGEAGEEGRWLHVFGGRDLRPGEEGRVLSEGWRFDPVAQTWTSTGPIAPEKGGPAVPLMGGTAVALEQRRLLVLGGDDGRLARVMEDNGQRRGPIEERESYARLNAAMLAAHPGHRRAQLLYDARLEVWRSAGSFPGPTPAVTPAFLWDGAIVLVGGEPAPGRRSANVWLGSLESE